MTTTEVREKPILFNSEMVRAILDGRKTVTRRPVKPQPQVTSDDDAQWRDADADLWRNARQYARDCSPYGKPGDRLWVRETWAVRPQWDDISPSNLPHGYATYFRASEPDVAVTRWRPSIHMPRWASRIALEITAVRVERAHKITDADVVAEGTPPEQIEKWRKFVHPNDVHGHAFGERWDAIYGKEFPWASNPWVWVVGFRRLP